VGPAVSLCNGRVLTIGSRWESNDRRRPRIVVIEQLDLVARVATVRNVVNQNVSKISFDAFSVGTRGWSRA
jgi:hypothetical protein